MAKVLATVENIHPTNTETPGNYILTLKETGGTRTVRIIIGIYDSQIIAFELQKLKSLRPLAHDFFKSVMDEFRLKIKHTEITSMDSEEGIFYANVNINNVTIDCRPSDGVILAMKYNVPIYIDESVFAKAGEEGPKQSFAQSNLTTETLIRTKQEALQSAIDNEDYVEAKKLTDEIEALKKRKPSTN